jgi:hypothetical protein
MKFILTGLLLELPKALAEAIVSSAIVDIILFICDLHSPFQLDNFVTPKYQRRESGSLLVLISKRSGCSVETGRCFSIGRENIANSCEGLHMAIPFLCHSHSIEATG